MNIYEGGRVWYGGEDEFGAVGCAVWGNNGAVAVCALGRALDFATTWVALGQGRAVEREPLATHVFHTLGPHAGLITYEALITTPAIFLGRRLATRVFCDRSSGDPVETALGERMFFVSIGVVSVIVAAFNARYLM